MRARTVECYRNRYALNGAAETLYRALGITAKLPQTASKTPRVKIKIGFAHFFSFLTRFPCNLNTSSTPVARYRQAKILLSNRGLVKPNRSISSFLLLAWYFCLIPASLVLQPAVQAQEPPINAEVQVGYQAGLAPGDRLR